MAQMPVSSMDCQPEPAKREKSYRSRAKSQEPRAKSQERSYPPHCRMTLSRNVCATPAIHGLTNDSPALGAGP